MFKRNMTALAAAAFATLGFAALPANGHDANAGAVAAYELEEFQGQRQNVTEAQIPATCSAVPTGLETVRSAQNATSGPGTTVAFFPTSDLACADAIVTLEPGESVSSIVDPNNPAMGAGRWMAVTS